MALQVSGHPEKEQTCLVWSCVPRMCPGQRRPGAQGRPQGGQPGVQSRLVALGMLVVPQPWGHACRRAQGLQAPRQLLGRHIVVQIACRHAHVPDMATPSVIHCHQHRGGQELQSGHLSCGAGAVASLLQ